MVPHTFFPKQVAASREVLFAVNSLRGRCCITENSNFTLNGFGPSANFIYLFYFRSSGNIYLRKRILGRIVRLNQERQEIRDTGLSQSAGLGGECQSLQALDL